MQPRRSAIRPAGPCACFPLPRSARHTSLRSWKIRPGGLVDKPSGLVDKVGELLEKLSLGLLDTRSKQLPSIVNIPGCKPGSQS